MQHARKDFLENLTCNTLEIKKGSTEYFRICYCSVLLGRSYNLEAAMKHVYTQGFLFANCISLPSCIPLNASVLGAY